MKKKKNKMILKDISKLQSEISQSMLSKEMLEASFNPVEISPVLKLSKSLMELQKALLLSNFHLENLLIKHLS